MEMEEIESNPSRFSRSTNGRRRDSSKIGDNGGDPFQDDDEEGDPRNGVLASIISNGDSEINRSANGDDDGSGARFRGWHNSSRIIRVSRTTGGKDRHSKVLTSRGLRDRRIRLSVTTAIQFYDLQDRLGYDQPSKAVEWLIKAAADPIAELPSLNNSFPSTPNQQGCEKKAKGFDSAVLELDGEAFQHQRLSLSNPACSSTSDTSKGSGLSLARTAEVRESRGKARERARERASKEKDQISHGHHQSVGSPNASLADLLAGTTNASSTQQQKQWSTASTTTTTPMDYFTTGLLGPSASRAQHASNFSQQVHMGNSLPHSTANVTVPSGGFNLVGENTPELQHFSLVPDHLNIPIPSHSVSDQNLNFTISSSLAGFNRGTLQSNFSSLWPQIQRYSPAEATNMPFFFGAPTPLETHHHHQFPPGLQLCYGDGSRVSDQKGKGKN